MADTTQERTEEATQRRREEAASKGQVAFSREMTSAVLLLCVLTALWLAGGALIERLQGSFRRALRLEDVHEIHPSSIGSFLTHVARDELGALAPLLLGVLSIVLLSGFLQVGIGLRWKRVEPNFERLDPLQGAKRLLSLRSVMALALNLAKVTVVGVLLFFSVEDLLPVVATLGMGSLRDGVSLLPDVLFRFGFRVGGLVFLLAAVDVLWQRFRHGRDLMMTKEEVKEDRKRSEGDPRIKARIRQIQRQMARARMMQDVRRATFVVRNPTHFAVALRYEKDKDPAPRVVAKGQDLVALKIIEVAKQAGVPVRSDPPLARQLHATVAVGQVVPEQLFHAVAKVLAWVLKRRGGKRLQAAK